MVTYSRARPRVRPGRDLKPGCPSRPSLPCPPTLAGSPTPEQGIWGMKREGELKQRLLAGQGWGCIEKGGREDGRERQMEKK